MANKDGNCTCKIVSKLALDATSATISTPSPMDDAAGNVVHAVASAMDGATRPRVDAMFETFLASKCTGGSSNALNMEYGYCSKSNKVAEVEAQQ